MALVANGIVRFSLNGTSSAGTTWTNIWDVWFGGVVDEAREEAASIYAGLLLEIWRDNVASSLTNDVVLQNVAWVDLDSLDGSTGVRTSGLTTSPPYTGAITTEGSPTNVSILVTKVGSGGRGRRNGRMYLPGLPEEDAAATELLGPYASVLQDRLDTFLSQATDPVEVPGEAITPAIVHTQNIGTEEEPNIVFTGWSEIRSLSLQTLLATQRRRLRR